MTSATLTTCHAALIPAKRHSSRCPDKNWREFLGERNLTELALAAVPRDLFSKVILSTDHCDFQPSLPCELHHRAAHLATRGADVQELVRIIVEEYGLHDSYVWLLNPTSPFRQTKDFERISGLIEQTGCPAVISVTPAGPFLWKGDHPLFSTSGRRVNTQDAPEEYFAENGMFYVVRGADFLQHGSWYVPGVRRYVQRGVLPRIDIDSTEDFQQARRIAVAWAARDEPQADTVGSGAPSREVLRREALAIEDLVSAPVAPHVKLLADHFGRYARAIATLRIDGSHRVLDASCGSGYGSFLLAQSAGHVVGLDVRPEYLEVARRQFVGDNLEFLTYDAWLAGPHEPFDKLVCIETYEHVPPGKLPVFLERVLAVLRSGGDVFLTCPLGDDGPSTVNPYHLNEPRLVTLHERFSRHFAKCCYSIAQRQDSFGQLRDYCCATLAGYKGGWPA